MPDLYVYLVILFGACVVYYLGRDLREILCK